VLLSELFWNSPLLSLVTLILMRSFDEEDEDEDADDEDDIVDDVAG
jgi:hypothetical protein